MQNHQFFPEVAIDLVLGLVKSFFIEVFPLALEHIVHVLLEIGVILDGCEFTNPCWNLKHRVNNLF